MTVFAHGGVLSHALGRWTWDPITIALILTSAFVYARGVSALWIRAGRGRGVAVWQAIAFAIGLGSLALALLSPLACSSRRT